MRVRVLKIYEGLKMMLGLIRIAEKPLSLSLGNLHGNLAQC